MNAVGKWSVVLAVALLPKMAHAAGGYAPGSEGYWVHGVVGSLVYGAIGLVIFGLAFWVMAKLSPFCIRKEIEEDQNTALAVLMGAVIIGIAIIVASAING